SVTTSSTRQFKARTFRQSLHADTSASAVDHTSPIVSNSTPDRDSNCVMKKSPSCGVEDDTTASTRYLNRMKHQPAESNAPSAMIARPRPADERKCRGQITANTPMLAARPPT